MIREQLIHFAWQYQSFDGRNLRTIAGDEVSIVSPGTYNRHAGPDFLDGTIRLNGITWKGNIEIHVKSSDWKHHGHSGDPSYNNVILHVVWEDDHLVYRSDGTVLPTIALAERVNPKVLNKYQAMQGDFIPCRPLIHKADPAAMVRALEENFEIRLEKRARRVFNLWHRNRFDWEQTTFVWLARHMGFHVNNELFEALAQSIPFRILQRHRDRPFQVEAILFGMAGMLESGHERDTYWARLKAEFGFLRHKYSLRPRIKPHEWRFLRMRPANFPTVRIAQLASLICGTESLVNWVLFGFSAGSRDVTAVSEYWSHHYYFGRMSRGPTGKMGKSSCRQLWLNVVPPMRLALKLERGQWDQRTLVFDSFFSIAPEDNNITRKWKELGVTMGSAMDSQSYYALFHQACKLRKCLKCPVGIDLLRSA